MKFTGHLMNKSPQLPHSPEHPTTVLPYDRSDRLLIHRLCLQSSATSRVAYVIRCRLISDFVSGKKGRSEIDIGGRLLVTPMVCRCSVFAEGRCGVGDWSDVGTTPLTNLP